jgi:hypothetical protein
MDIKFFNNCFCYFIFIFLICELLGFGLGFLIYKFDPNSISQHPYVYWIFIPTSFGFLLTLSFLAMSQIIFSCIRGEKQGRLLDEEGQNEGYETI